MSIDFLAARIKLASATARVVPPFVWSDAQPGKCWKNVQSLVVRHGGTVACGWALSGLGPTILSGQQIPPLYSRWINHVVWRDNDGKLWEASPTLNPLNLEITWGSMGFVLDDDALFEVNTDDICCPQPAIYVATRPEGEWTADCLCQAERASSDAQENWLQRAVYSLRQAGCSPTDWQLKWVGDHLRHITIMAIA